MKLNDLEDLLALLCHIEGQLSISKSGLLSDTNGVFVRLTDLIETVQNHRHEMVRKISHGEFL